MDISLRDFRLGLYEEHLEEGAFLYAQCRFLRQDGSQPWRGLADFERRLDLHLDALVVGADAALELCRRRAADGDPDELFVALCLFCRQSRSPLLAEVLKRLDAADPARTAAVADALKYELPAPWLPFVEQALARQDARLLPVLAAVCGYRRLRHAEALTDALLHGPAPPLALVEALGRLRAPGAEHGLKRLLGASDPALRSAALIALLRSGSDTPLRGCYLVAQEQGWPRIALGLGGDAAAAHALAQPPESGRVDADSLLALGLLGLPATIGYLNRCLRHPELAESAALAMSWICGADLRTEVLVPDPVNEDELFPRELAAWRQHRQPPLAADGRPFGVTRSQIQTEPEPWRRWLEANASRFDPRLRYRSGRPYSPAALLENLASDASDPRLRACAAHELIIRFGCDLPFEVAMPVAAQQQALRALGQWVEAQRGRFQPGGWYFNGRPMAAG